MGLTWAPRSLGRWTALAAGLGAAAVGGLAAPPGFRWCRESYAIHQLQSEEHGVVSSGLATLMRLQSERGAKRVFELRAKEQVKWRVNPDDDGVRESMAAMWRALLSLPLKDDWILQKAASPSMDERLLAIGLIGEKKLSRGLPLLRKIASNERETSEHAILALVQALPTLKLLRTETTGKGIKATFRFANLTGHKLWYYGIGGSPHRRKVVEGSDQFITETIGIDIPFEPGESIDLEEDFAWSELPGAVMVQVQADDGNGDKSVQYVTYPRSEVVEAPLHP